MRLFLTFVCTLALGCGGQETLIDWSSYHACNGNANVWLHSPTPHLLVHPEIHLVFWGSWWETSNSSQMNDMIVEWNVVANDPNFYSGLSEYKIQSGFLVGTYTANWNVTGLLSENSIQTEIQSEISNNILPPSNSNTLYVICLPPEVRSQYDVANKFGGHHGNHDGFTFAVIEYNNAKTMGLAISHEIYESCTNADGTGFNGGPGETEIGDYCGGINYNLDGYTIQMLWSQKQCKCVQ